MKAKVVYDAKKCIGAGNCIVSEYFLLPPPGKKAVLKGARLVNKEVCLEKDFTIDELNRLREAGERCPVNAIGLKNLETNEELVTMAVKQDNVKEIKAEYDDDKEFVLDPKGYFLIRVDNLKKLIEIGFCGKRNTVEVKIFGNLPRDIYNTVAKEKLIDRPEHYAYLGRELQKAYIALKLGLKYVQDDELDFNLKT